MGREGARDSEGFPKTKKACDIAGSFCFREVILT